MTQLQIPDGYEMLPASSDERMRPDILVFRDDGILQPCDENGQTVAEWLRDNSGPTWSGRVRTYGETWCYLRKIECLTYEKLAAQCIDVQVMWSAEFASSPFERRAMRTEMARRGLPRRDASWMRPGEDDDRLAVDTQHEDFV